MFQADDPHHFHPNFNYLYVFLIVAPVITFVVIYLGLKLGTYLDLRSKAWKGGGGKKEKIDNQNNG